MPFIVMPPLGTIQDHHHSLLSWSHGRYLLLPSTCPRSICLLLQGIMLVYDITSEKSFDNIKNWIRNIEEVGNHTRSSSQDTTRFDRSFLFQHASAEVERMLIGNKCDMQDKRQVSRERGEQVHRIRQTTILTLAACFVSALCRIRHQFHGNECEGKYCRLSSVCVATGTCKASLF